MPLIPSEFPDYLGNHHPERPLPPGSIIDCSGIKYEVVSDDGGEMIEVRYEDEVSEIVWDLADIVCTVDFVNKD